MTFLNIPLKALQAELSDVNGIESMPWYNPIDFPVPPGAPAPIPLARDYRWRVTFSISPQPHSSYVTRQPGLYNGLDVTVGQWISNVTTGQAWRIISIESKSITEVTAIIQDVYRYNTFRDQGVSGIGAPTFGPYIVFELNDEGMPQIDPIPASSVSTDFTQNIQSRFEYINLQYDYPLFIEDNTFVEGDVIAADPDNNTLSLADDTHRQVIGRITSISDTLPGWVTINPVTKIVEDLDYLPGEVGHTIYASPSDPSDLTLEPGGPPVYINIKKYTSSVSSSIRPGPTTPGNVFQLNGIDITVGGTGIASDLITAVNGQSSLTGVSASETLLPTVAQTNPANLSPNYGEILLEAATSPATATINGVEVVFNILSTSPGYELYTQAAQMAEAINNAAIPNIVATSPIPQELILTNDIGEAITIVNGTGDNLGVLFAGDLSGSGIVLDTPASTESEIKFTAVDARAINFLNVTGITTVDFGLISVENGTKAAGLYITDGLRQGGNTVVLDLAQRDALSPMIGDQVYVIDSDDGEGNNVGQWSMWIWDGVAWVRTSNEDSAATDAKSLEYTLTSGSTSSIEFGNISTGRRVTLITVEVTEVFDGPALLNIGYKINNPDFPPSVPDGLMSTSLIDLTVLGTYTTTSDILFGLDTAQGDVTITGNFILAGSTTGVAQIIVSYV